MMRLCYRIDTESIYFFRTRNVFQDGKLFCQMRKTSPYVLCCDAESVWKVRKIIEILELGCFFTLLKKLMFFTFLRNSVKIPPTIFFKKKSQKKESYKIYGIALRNLQKRTLHVYKTYRFRIPISYRASDARQLFIKSSRAQMKRKKVSNNNKNFVCK